MSRLTFALLICSLPIFSADAQTTLRIEAKAPSGVKDLGIRGNTAPLSWESTLPLTDADGDGIFTGELQFSQPIDKLVEFKLVYGEKTITWELEGKNRFLIPGKIPDTITCTWDTYTTPAIEELPLLTPDQLLADLALTRKAMEAIHPGLHRYLTPEAMDSLFNSYERVFSKAMTYGEAFLNFSKLTAAIRCGHTYPNFFNQPGFIQQVVLSQPDKLPFVFRVIDRRIIITASADRDHNLPPGTEVVTINGIAAKDILYELMRYVKADGSNDNKRLSDLNTFGIGPYEAFDVYFPLLHPPVNGQYELTVAYPGAQAVTPVSVTTMDRYERLRRIAEADKNYPATPDQLWKLEFLEGEIAYMQLATFDEFQLSFEWNKWLNDAFQQIRKKKITRLIIDIRWNEGGQDAILYALGRQLSVKPVTTVPRKSLVRYAKVPEDLKPYVFTWDNSFYDLSARVMPDENGFYRLPEDELNIPPSSKPFQGEVVMLINAANSSATFYFAELFKNNAIGKLIGSTTGGSQKGLNAGTLFFLRLPNSMIEIDIPIIGTYSPELPAGGIEPDITASETIEDIINGTDSVIRAAREYLLR